MDKLGAHSSTVPTSKFPCLLPYTDRFELYTKRSSGANIVNRCLTITMDYVIMNKARQAAFNVEAALSRATNHHSDQTVRRLEYLALVRSASAPLILHHSCGRPVAGNQGRRAAGRDAGEFRFGAAADKGISAS